MSTFGFFQPAVLGMGSQSHALSAIGTNIANVRTGGHKRTDVHFATVLSQTVSSHSGQAGGTPAGTMHSDFGGVRPKDYARIDTQGLVETTNRQLDVAINGRGMFVLNTRADGGGETLFGRDGRFDMTTTPEVVGAQLNGQPIGINQGFLVDKNGHFVQGWAANPDGTFPDNGGVLSSLRVDSFAFADAGEPTSRAALALNLPATALPGDQETFSIDVFDAAGERRDLFLAFERDVQNRTWNISVDPAPGETATFDPPAPLVFRPDGELESPTQYQVTITSGTPATFTLDVAGFTQFGNSFSAFNVNRDGFAASEMRTFRFDSAGHVIGEFGSGMTKPIYRLALADFANVNGLEARNGNVYGQGVNSGEPRIGGAGQDGFGDLLVTARELSNVDLAQEFATMIMTQGAYNASATSFRTMDEMTEVARDLKR
ncbi:MAG: flagellar hook-basal body complex protein [Rhodospirillales bacterium]|nr:MAG: flagellar hook-basal body complex protein [Rhodospirillales bacterium]